MRLCNQTMYAVLVLISAAAHAQEQPIPEMPTPPNNVRNQPSTSAVSSQLILVPVLSATPVTTNSGSTSDTSYKVIYEYSGRQFSVQLPQDPGSSLTLQVPVTTQTAASDVTIVSVEPIYALPVQSLPYPYVWVGGVLYRPMPFIAGSRYFGGAFRHGGRRGGHR